MNKKERRIFARRYKAAVQLRHCFESRFMERLGEPVEQARHAMQMLEGLDLMELRAEIELYAATRRHKHRHKVTHRLQYELQAAREVIDKAAQLILKDLEVFSETKSDPLMRSTPVPTVTNLIDDLKALEREFPKWQLIDDEFVVTTDPIIVTDGDCGSVNFGQFEIRLNLDSIERAGKAYRLVALQPNRRDDFVHPHVSGNRLCEGAAEYPILNAMNNGLFYDFFLIVRNTLIEYNAGSPYVKLGRWTGFHDDEDEDDSDDYTHCTICDSRIHNDDAYCCDDCNEAVCERHNQWCEAAERTICESCISYYKAGLRDAYGRLRTCCTDHVGESDCHLHTNQECWCCGEAPSDKHKITCELGDRILCGACADDIVSDDVNGCDDCEKAGHRGCALVPMGFPAKREEGDGTTQESPQGGQEGQAATLEAINTG